MDDACIDEIWDTCCELMVASEFVGVDSMLRIMHQLDRAPVDAMITWLTVTLPAKSKLPSRPDFFKRVKEELKRRGEWTEDILTGLE
jgi:hypothetical protein